MNNNDIALCVYLVAGIFTHVCASVLCVCVCVAIGDPLQQQNVVSYPQLVTVDPQANPLSGELIFDSTVYYIATYVPILLSCVIYGNEYSYNSYVHVSLCVCTCARVCACMCMCIQS